MFFNPDIFGVRKELYPMVRLLRTVGVGGLPSSVVGAMALWTQELLSIY